MALRRGHGCVMLSIEGMMVAYESNMILIWRPIEYQNENENEWIMRGGLLIALSQAKNVKVAWGAPF